MDDRTLRLSAVAAGVVAAAGIAYAVSRDENRTSSGGPVIVTSSVKPPAVVAPREVVEFRLEVGKWRHDVTNDAIAVDGTLLRLSPRAVRRFVGETFWFEHPSTMSVVAGDPVIVGMERTTARLHALRGDSEEGAALEALSKRFASLEKTAATRGIGEREASGLRFAAGPGETLEVFAPSLSAELRLGVVVTLESPDGVGALGDVLKGIRAGKGEPQPLFDLEVQGRSVPLMLGQTIEVQMGEEKRAVRLLPRPKLRRRVGALSVEHSPAVVATHATQLEGEVLSLTSDAGQMTVAYLPERVDRAEIAAALGRGSPLANAVPAERTVAKLSRTGQRGTIATPAGALTGELYAYPELGGMVAIMFMYDEGGVGDAWAMVEPIWASVDKWSAATVPEEVRQPPLEVVKHLEKCDAGDADACRAAAGWFLDDDDAEPDYERARALFEKACTHGHNTACHQLGITLQEGLGGPVDEKRARSLYKKTCDADAQLCVDLAGMQWEGKGGEVDLQGALQLYDRACKAESALACHNFARMHEEGAGTRKDTSVAQRMYEDNCKAGYARSCSAAGRVREDNGKSGARYYRRACKLGDKEACKKAPGRDDEDD